MKRKYEHTRSETGYQSQTRKEGATQSPTFRDVESARVEAEPYRLATAKFRVDALTPVWSTGKNRPVDHKHVQRLCRIFIQSGGVDRKSWDNRLLVLCTRHEVEKMIRHIRENPSATLKSSKADGGSGSIEWPSFDEWASVNGRMVELMAGQHRANALREYVRQTGCGDEELWWVCDIYDAGMYINKLNPSYQIIIESRNLTLSPEYQATSESARPNVARLSRSDLATISDDFLHKREPVPRQEP